MTGHISGLDARMVLDSRGQPTVEVDCFVDGALSGRAIVPSEPQRALTRRWNCEMGTLPCTLERAFRRP